MATLSGANAFLSKTKKRGKMMWKRELRREAVLADTSRVAEESQRLSELSGKEENLLSLGEAREQQNSGSDEDTGGNSSSAQLT